MKKLFGEYLLESQVISTDQLVESLVEQVRNIPAVSEIVFQSGMLSMDEMLKIFICQSHKKLDFIGACQDLGLWNQGLENLIHDESSKEMVTLTEIIMNKGFATQESLGQALEGYLAETAETSEQSEDNSTSVEAEPILTVAKSEESPPMNDETPAEVPTEIEQVSEEVPQNVQELSPFLANYCELFNEDIKVVLEHVFSQVQLTSSIRAIDSQAAQSILQLQGSAQLAGLDQAHQFFGELHRLWEKREDCEDLGALGEKIVPTLEKIWGQRSEISAGHSASEDSSVKEFIDDLRKVAA